MGPCRIKHVQSLIGENTTPIKQNEVRLAELVSAQVIIGAAGDWFLELAQVSLFLKNHPSDTFLNFNVLEGVPVSYYSSHQFCSLPTLQQNHSQILIESIVSNSIRH